MTIFSSNPDMRTKNDFRGYKRLFLTYLFETPVLSSAETFGWAREKARVRFEDRTSSSGIRAAKAAEPLPLLELRLLSIERQLQSSGQVNGLVARLIFYGSRFATMSSERRTQRVERRVDAIETRIRKVDARLARMDKSLLKLKDQVKRMRNSG